MSTLMTERRRPLDNDDGQEALFGGEAFAAGPPAPTPWEREHASAPRARHASAPEASAHLPLEAEAPPVDVDRRAFEAEPHVGDAGPRAFDADELPAGDAGAHSFETGVASTGEYAPFDEGQYLTGYETGPSTADLAAYDFEVGAPPTEVPAHDAGDELAALEQATIASPDSARRPRAPLAGPTLDDVMSRAWEGLVTGLPAACPVCDGEMVPSFAGSVHGSCSSCGTTIE
jgi:hypothetical protein